MTGAVPLWGDADDAALALAAAAGDRQAFGEIYDRYADRLFDFCVGLAGVRDAADCVQDAFCVAATSLAALREPDKLRPWLYSITRHQAMRRLRDRYREDVAEDLPDTASGDDGPETVAGRSELARLVSDAAGGLSDRDREVLDLTYRHGLDGPELAEALGVTLTNANTMVFRLRQTIERSLGALLVARGARPGPDACADLMAILDGWDGHFTILMRKRISRHIESCQQCDHDRRRRVNPVALLGAAPVLVPAPGWLREHTLGRVQLTSASSPLDDSLRDPHPHPTDDRGEAPPRPGADDGGRAETPTPTARAGGRTDAVADRGRRVFHLVALFMGVPLTVLGLTFAWLGQQSTSVTPLVTSGTDPRGGDTGPPSTTVVRTARTSTSRTPPPSAGTTAVRGTSATGSRPASTAVLPTTMLPAMPLPTTTQPGITTTPYRTTTNPTTPTTTAQPTTTDVTTADVTTTDVTTTYRTTTDPTTPTTTPRTTTPTTTPYRTTTNPATPTTTPYTTTVQRTTTLERTTTNPAPVTTTPYPTDARRTTAQPIPSSQPVPTIQPIPTTTLDGPVIH